MLSHMTSPAYTHPLFLITIQFKILKNLHLVLSFVIEGGTEKKKKTTENAVKKRKAQRGGAETFYYQTKPFNQ